MIVLSLFDGCGMAYQALKNLGIKVDKYYSSEIDKYAIQIARKNHPDITELGDVNNWKSWDIEKPDLIIGGFPCQSFSIAGNRTNFEDTRGQLFFTALEILQHYNPQHFILENVASMQKEIKAQLDKLIGVEGVKINSALVSAQQRNRYYWTNATVTQPEDKGIYLKDILLPEVDDKYYLSKQVVDRLNLGDLVRCGVVGYKVKGQERDKATTLLSRDYKGMQSRDFNVVIDKPVRAGSFNKGGQGDRVYSPEGKSVSLSTLGGGRGAKTGLYLHKGCVRKLTPIECERLQTLPDCYSEGVSDSQRYKMLGNGFTVKVIEHLLRELKECKNYDEN